MSGQLIGGIIGGAIGFFAGGNVALGFTIGSAIGGAVAPGELPTQYGPRLEDLRPQTSEYGKPIPIVYGTVGMGGNVIWASDYVEKEAKTESGGKGGPSQTTVQYEYFGNFAVMFAEGPASIGRMWAGPGKRLIYDGTLIEGGGSVRIYDGSESQLPDALLESYLGAGNVPAYRGYCYVVFEMYPLAKDGNALPFITAEVGAKAGVHGQAPVPVAPTTVTGTAEQANAVVDPATGWIWKVTNGFLAPSYTVTVINDAKKAVIATFTVPMENVTVRGIVAAPGGNAVYVLLDTFYATGPSTKDEACVGTFAAGQANPDGSVLDAPAFLGNVYYGNAPPATPNPIYPAAIGQNGFGLWIAYAFSNAAQFKLAIFSSPTIYTEIAGGRSIGNPFQIVGNNRYMGLAGSLGDGSINFIIYSGTGQPLHALAVPADVQGKAYDFDPVRNVFIAYRRNGLGWYSIAADTGIITTRTLTTPPGSDTTPAPAQAATAVTYSSKTDRYLIGSSTQGAGTGTTVYVVNPTTGTTEGAYTFEAGGVMLNPLLDPVGNTTGAPYVLSFDTNSVKRLYLAGAVVATPINLGAIVADLSTRAGLLTYDVSQLTDSVPGYAIARQTTVRAAIDALRPAYYFDAVESGGIVKFPKRGGQSIVTIGADDLDAHEANGEMGDPLLTTRQMEVELPNVVNVNYLSAATDYEKGTKLAKRLIGASREESTLDLPLVLTDTKAQEIAEVNLHVPWVQRLTYAFTLPRKYAYLEPTDVVTVKGRDMIINKITATPGGLLKCEGVATDSSQYTPHVVVTETVPINKIVTVPGDTILELM